MEVILPKSFDTFGKLIIGLSVAFVTYSVNEIRTDVKDLMAASNVNSTKIQGIEARVDNLEQVMYFDKLNKTALSDDNTLPANKAVNEFTKVFYVREEENNIKKRKL